jgi:hypothetical protein
MFARSSALVVASIVASNLAAAPAHATDPKANRMLAAACGFPLIPTGAATLPMAVGDGSFYYVSSPQMEALKAGTFDYSGCDWNAAMVTTYGDLAPEDATEDDIEAIEQAIVIENTLKIQNILAEQNGELHEQIARYQQLIATCGFPRRQTDDRTIEIKVGNGDVFYVNETEAMGIANPASGFQPCAAAPQDQSTFARSGRASPNGSVLDQSGSGRTTQATSVSKPPAETPPQELVPVANVDLNSQLDRVIATDARSWMFNRYNVGSARNAQIIDYDTNTQRVVVYGEYTYNSASTGWIKVVFAGDNVDCVEYHDFRGTCRSLGNNPAAYLALGVAAAAAAGSSGGTVGSSSSGQTCHDTVDPGVPGSRRRVCY